MSAALYKISNGLLTAKVTNFGASLTSLELEGHTPNLVLGYADLDDFVADGQFMGAVIGRYANRISNQPIDINGSLHSLEKNENGHAHLHGGSSGIGTRYWALLSQASDEVTFSIRCKDGESGYPGNLDVTATYAITDQSTLSLSVSATTDKDTVINICHHPYFNLSGDADIFDHKLEIRADLYLPSDALLVPTGETAFVNQSKYDFRKPRSTEVGPYNNTFCLHNSSQSKVAHAATLTCAERRLEVWTTQPGLHLYDGYKLRQSKVGHHGHPYSAHAGICLEAQAWPDSPNNLSFPSTILEKDATYAQTVEYRIF